MQRRSFLKGAGVGLGATLLSPQLGPKLVSGTAQAATSSPLPVDATGFIKVTEGSNRFPALTVGFNQRWKATGCEAIYLCQTSEGVVNAINDSQKNGPKKISVKSGGHCYENFVYNEEVKAIIDVSMLNDIGKDSNYGYYLESGTTNWDAYKTLFNYGGKTLPAGSCYSVGIGGHICGGGYGLLSRKFGLTVDWLTSIDVVVYQNGVAREVHASKNDPDPSKADLFWAHTGGGGGSFGVVTRYYFGDTSRDELPDAPAYADLTVLEFKYEDNLIGLNKFKDLMRIFGEWCHKIDRTDDFVTQAEIEKRRGIFALLKLKHKKHGACALVIQSVFDSEAEGDEVYNTYIKTLIQSFRDADILVTKCTGNVGGHPVNVNPCGHETQRLSWYEMTESINGSGPNRRGDYKSAYHTEYELTVGQVEALHRGLISETVKDDSNVDHSTDKLGEALVQIDNYGGIINEVSPTETVIPQRNSKLKAQYQVYWANNLAEDGGNEISKEISLNWIRGIYKDVFNDFPDVAPDFGVNIKKTDGCYRNYPDVDLGKRGDNLDRALTLYFKGNYKGGPNNPRNLVDIKTAWDPTDLFNHDQSIPLGDNGNQCNNTPEWVSSVQYQAGDRVRYTDNSPYIYESQWGINQYNTPTEDYYPGNAWKPIEAC